MILLSCCTEMEIKGGSLIGLFLTDWGRYFQALGSFWHRGSAAKLPFFLRIMDWIVEWIPTKHFQHDHILKGWDLSVASLREIGTAGRTLCDQYVFVYLFLCICLFLSVFLTFLYVLLKQQSWAQPFKSKIRQKFSQFLETRTQWEPADATSYYTC